MSIIFRAMAAACMLGSLVACISMPKTHLAMLDSGVKPKITVVASAPDRLFINYLGHTVFQNWQTFVPVQFGDEPLQSHIAKSVRDHLNETGKVELIEAHKGQIDNLQGFMQNELSFYWEESLFEEEIQNIATWGQALATDYVLLVFPKSEPQYGLWFGSGIHTGPSFKSDGSRLMTVNASYEMVLIDVAAKNISDRDYSKTFENVPLYRNELSTDQIKLIEEEWKKDKAALENQGKPLTLLKSKEKRILEASYYNQQDFENMQGKVLTNTVDHTLKLLSQNIEQNLINLSLIPDISSNASNN